MHQVYKWNEGTIDEMSDYCPLKLYSEIEDVMIDGLKDMLRCPQSNLKIYYGSECLIGTVSE